MGGVESLSGSVKLILGISSKVYWIVRETERKGGKGGWFVLVTLLPLLVLPVPVVLLSDDVNDYCMCCCLYWVCCLTL